LLDKSASRQALLKSKGDGVLYGVRGGAVLLPLVGTATVEERKTIGVSEVSALLELRKTPRFHGAMNAEHRCLRERNHLQPVFKVH